MAYVHNPPTDSEQAATVGASASKPALSATQMAGAMRNDERPVVA
jgi:hypothetical protein